MLGIGLLLAAAAPFMGPFTASADTGMSGRSGPNYYGAGAGQYGWQPMHLPYMEKEKEAEAELTFMYLHVKYEAEQS